MKNKLFTFILGILLISFVLAEININSGENYSFESEEFEYYEVNGNSSNLDGMNITWKGGNTTLSFSKYFASDNFTLTFFNSEDKVIHHYSSGGGGSSGGGFSCTYNPNYDWNCSEWGNCINETQTRTCKEKNNCGNFYGKPNLTQTCTPIILQKDTQNETDLDEPEPKEDLTWIYVLLGFLVVIVSILFFKLFKKKEEKKEKSEKEIKN